MIKPSLPILPTFPTYLTYPTYLIYLTYLLNFFKTGSSMSHFYDGWCRIETLLNHIWFVEKSVLIYFEDLFFTGKIVLQKLLYLNIDIQKLSSNISLSRSSAIFNVVYIRSLSATVSHCTKITLLRGLASFYNDYPFQYTFQTMT